MPRTPDTSNEIGAALLSRKTPEAGESQARVKYPSYKKLLRETVATYPPGTRLPPLRHLAKTLDISLVTAQRVITELVNDGILFSRPRSGVFVAKPNGRPTKTLGGSRGNDKPPAGDANSESAPGCFESVFRFGTNSQLPFQRRLWQQLAKLFEQRYPNTRPQISFLDDPAKTKEQMDVYERLDWNVGWSGEESRVLNLREHAPETLQARSTAGGLLPLYHRSNFLFFNRELLDQCGVPAPDFRDFAGQHDYLREISPKLKEQGFEPLPFSVQQPITLLGTRHLELFFSLVYDATSHGDAYDQLLEVLESTLLFSHHCQRAPGIKNPLADENRQRFLRGQDRPIFLGHSVDYWQFSNTTPPFTVECYPMLSSDESLFLWPMVGAVARESQHPIQAIRFLSFLIGDEAQQVLTRTGAYASDLSPTALPAMAADEEWLAEVLGRSQAMQLSSPDRFYLAIHVLNNELWQVLLEHTDTKQALDEALQFGRIYVNRKKASSKPSS